MYKGFSRIKNRKMLITSLAIFMSFGLVLPNSLRSSAHTPTQTRTCINVISGNGAEGTTDPVVQFFNGTTYQNAFIIPPHTDNDGQPPDTNYAVIPGTHYIAVTVDGHGAEQADHLFKASFTLPPTFTNPSFSIQVHCDNQATIFLNGNNLGSQPFAEDIINFQNPAEAFSTTNPVHFVAGTNVLQITAHNFTDRIALDFKADICFDTAGGGCVDEDAPSVSCSVDEDQLWPPNHDLENVGLSANVSDDCDCNEDDNDNDHGHHSNSQPDDSKSNHGGNHGGGGGHGGGGHDGDDCDNPQGHPTAVQVIVYSDEPDLDITGSGNFSPDAKNIGVGTLRLREERSGNADGRVYLVVVKGTDGTGKIGYCAKTVTVPHSQSRAAKDSVAAQANAARTYFINNHTPPPGYVQVGTGPIVGPKQ